MYVDTLFANDEYEDVNFNSSRFVDGFRNRYGNATVGCADDDTGLSEYEEMLDLGMALRSIGAEY